jgi:hypothetical protein
VTLGLCSQIDLDLEVSRAAKEKPLPAEQAVTLLPADVTTAAPTAEAPEEPEKKPAEELDVEAVFARLKKIGGKQEGKQEE